MGFYTRLEKIDGVVNRGYARWGRWVWGSLLAAILAYAGWTVWAAVWGPPTGPVTLIIHSEIDRPIRGFSVNGVAGSNAYANGGGGATCCGSISGDTAEVIWTVDYTLAQYNAGVRTEIHKIVMPLPPRKWGETTSTSIFCREIKCCWAGVITRGRPMKNSRLTALKRHNTNTNKSGMSTAYGIF